MAKYEWTIEDIKNKYKSLKKSLITEKNFEKRKLIIEDIKLLKYCIQDAYDTEIEEQLKILEGYEYFKSVMNKITFVWDDILQFGEITATPLLKIPPIKEYNLSEDDIFDLTHDFYKTLDKSLYKAFMINFKRRYNHAKFGEINGGLKGESINICSNQESFITIDRGYTLDDVITSIHEYSHATSSAINPKHLLPPKNLYQEIDTLFMELISADYLENIFQNGDALLIRANEHGTYANTADILTAQIELIDYEEMMTTGYNNNRDIKRAGAKFEIRPQEIENIFTKPIMHQEVYLVSYIFALELYNIYLEDKDKALYYLIKIIELTCKSKEEYYSSILKFGIIPNLNLPELHKKITDEALKLTRKNRN